LSSGRLHSLGAAPPPISRRNLTEGNLSAALDRMLGSDAMNENAVFLSERMRTENGTGRAVELIEAAVQR